MKHKNIEELIQKSLDRETNTEEELKLRSHLAHCHDCQQFYEELALTEQMLGGLIELFPQSGFNERVLSKIGIKRTPVWSKAGIVFAGAWLGSLLLLVFSPLPGQLFNRILTSTPTLLRLSNKVQIIISSLSHMVIPFVKNSLNLSYPVIGLIFSILLFYFFGKTISPVRNLKDNIKPYPKTKVF